MQYNFPSRKIGGRETRSKHFGSKLKKALKLQSIKKLLTITEWKFLCLKQLQPSTDKKRQQQKAAVWFLSIFAKENINISFRKFFTKSEPICCLLLYALPELPSNNKFYIFFVSCSICSIRCLVFTEYLYIHILIWGWNFQLFLYVDIAKKYSLKWKTCKSDSSVS